MLYSADVVPSSPQKRLSRDQPRYLLDAQAAGKPYLNLQVTNQNSDRKTDIKNSIAQTKALTSQPGRGCGDGKVADMRRWSTLRGLLLLSTTLR